MCHIKHNSLLLCFSRTRVLEHCSLRRGLRLGHPQRSARAGFGGGSCGEVRVSKGVVRKATHILCQMGLLCSALAEARNSQKKPKNKTTKSQKNPQRTSQRKTYRDQQKSSSTLQEIPAGVTLYSARLMHSAPFLSQIHPTEKVLIT